MNEFLEPHENKYIAPSPRICDQAGQPFVIRVRPTVSRVGANQAQNMRKEKACTRSQYSLLLFSDVQKMSIGFVCEDSQALCSHKMYF